MISRFFRLRPSMHRDTILDIYSLFIYFIAAV